MNLNPKPVVIDTGIQGSATMDSYGDKSRHALDFSSAEIHLIRAANTGIIDVHFRLPRV